VRRGRVERVLSMNDEQKALAVVDALIVEHALEVSERCRLVIALAYLQGQRDAFKDSAAVTDAALARLADDLLAAVKS
jgi:hypothetical protein